MYFDIQVSSTDFLTHAFYIAITNNHTHMIFDKDIAKALCLTKDEYQRILIKYGGIKENEIDESHNKSDIFFQYKQDVLKALKYLNNKYGLMLQLLS